MNIFRKTKIKSNLENAPDWQKKIDSKLEQDRIEAERQKQEVVMKEQEAVLRKKEEEKAISMAKYQKLGDSFQCHFCGVRSKEPGISIHTTTTSDYGVATGSYDTKYIDWDKPADLKKCSICNEWTCKIHLYKGICQKCAEKL